MNGWWIGAGLCMLYYIYTLISFGFSKFSLIFLVAGLILAVLGLMSVLHPGWFISLPKSVRFPVITLVGLILLIFIAVEIQIVYYAFCKPDPNADYVIVLGAQVDGEEASKSLYNRTMAAVDYLESYPEAKVIASGGKGPDEGISEALCIQRLLIASGIEPSRILMEDASTNTRENIANSAALVGKAHRFVIMTCNYHQCRAQRTARKMGLYEVSGKAVMSDPTLWPNYYLREFFAMIKYFYLG